MLDEAAVASSNNSKRTFSEAITPNGEIPESLSAENIKKLLEDADDNRIEQITSNNIRRVIAQFDKRIKKNQDDRIKYSDEPEKWIKSEVDLDEEVKKLKQIAALPELYGELISLGGIGLLLSLLNHVNTDIAIEALDVLSELTDPDTVSESEKPEEFIDALLDSQLPELTMDTILRINEDNSDEDFQGISNALQVVENLIDLHPDLCTRFAKVPNFLPYLLKRIRQSNAVDYNRVYASEILSIILQNSAESREMIGQKGGIDGIDKLLRSISAYRKRNPEDSEEEELVQNLFDCLCNLMLVPQHQLTFGKAQGLELMIRMMRERKLVCALAVRLTNFALSNCPMNCQIFVEKLGLKSVFSMFMWKGIKAKEGSVDEMQMEEHLTAIIQSLCKCCRGTSLARVISKFMELQGEKLERLLELHEKYQRRVEETSSSLRQHKETDALNKQLSINDEEQHYLDRCESGLFILQQVDCIVVRLANMGNSMVAQRIYTLLQTKGIPREQLQSNLNEYCNNLDETAEEEKAAIGEYLEQFLVASENFQKEIESKHRF